MIKLEQDRPDQNTLRWAQM